MDGADVGARPDAGEREDVHGAGERENRFMDGAEPRGLFRFMAVLIAAFVYSIVHTENRGKLWSGTTKLAVVYYSSSSEEQEGERGCCNLLLAYCCLLCVLLLSPWLGARPSPPMRMVVGVVGVVVLIVDYFYVHA